MLDLQYMLRSTVSFRQFLISTFGAVLMAVPAISFICPSEGWAEHAVKVPPPIFLEQNLAGEQSEKAVLAGGCFWGVQAVFQHVKGVSNVVSGYAGGNATTAQYKTVSGGATGHAESVEITFDPQIINYATILQVYFSVAHNPTELNYQGPDAGTQYRSAIFPSTNTQKKVAVAYIKQLGKSKVFSHRIVTKVEMTKAFYPAEGYHQDYATEHPDNPYIANNDLPKIRNLSRLYPGLYISKPKLVKGIDQAS